MGNMECRKVPFQTAHEEIDFQDVLIPICNNITQELDLKTLLIGGSYKKVKTEDKKVSTQIDGLFVTPTHIFIIEMKRYEGGILLPSCSKNFISESWVLFQEDSKLADKNQFIYVNAGHKNPYKQVIDQKISLISILYKKMQHLFQLEKMGKLVFSRKVYPIIFFTREVNILNEIPKDIEDCIIATPSTLQDIITNIIRNDSRAKELSSGFIRGIKNVFKSQRFEYENIEGEKMEEQNFENIEGDVIVVNEMIDNRIKEEKSESSLSDRIASLEEDLKNIKNILEEEHNLNRLINAKLEALNRKLDRSDISADKIDNSKLQGIISKIDRIASQIEALKKTSVGNTLIRENEVTINSKLLDILISSTNRYFDKVQSDMVNQSNS